MPNLVLYVRRGSMVSPGRLLFRFSEMPTAAAVVFLEEVAVSCAALRGTSDGEVEAKSTIAQPKILVRIKNSIL